MFNIPVNPQLQLVGNRIMQITSISFLNIFSSNQLALFSRVIYKRCNDTKERSFAHGLL